MYLGHFTNLRSLELILEKKKMKFSVLSNTNDPFENRNLLFKVAIQKKNLRIVTTTDRLSKENFKNYFKLICMTQAEQIDYIYEKPRMWEQYGDKHNGCCLVFDKNSFDYEFESIKKANEFYASRKVFYTLEKNKDKIQSMMFDEIIESRLRKIGFKKNIITDYIWENRGILLFQKMSDWMTEKEYRYCIYSFENENRYINISESLKEIILGEKVTNEYTKMLAKRYENEDVIISKIEWFNGFPQKKIVDNDYLERKINIGKELQELSNAAFRENRIE